MSEPLPTEGLRVKYRARNPIVRAFVRGFLDAFDSCVRRAAPSAVLEAGCGEGFLTDRIRTLVPGARIVGLDASAAVLAVARREFPDLPLVRGSIDRLPCADGGFDLVVACEVLEHVTDPVAALAEVRRVTALHALVSVPREPIWRMLNFGRGKYWSGLGNTPGHLQHWSTAAFLRLVRLELDVVEVYRPLPWTMVLCRIPGSSTRGAGER